MGSSDWGTGMELPIEHHPKANRETGAAPHLRSRRADGHGARGCHGVDGCRGVARTRWGRHLKGGSRRGVGRPGDRAETEAKRQDPLSVGKPELICLAAFDDVDMAMMVHNTSVPADTSLGVGATMNGCVMKTVILFRGTGAHAGFAPSWGATRSTPPILAFNAIHARRETFRDEDTIRVLWFIT